MTLRVIYHHHTHLMTKRDQGVTSCHWCGIRAGWPGLAHQCPANLKGVQYPSTTLVTEDTSNLDYATGPAEGSYLIGMNHRG